MAARIRIDHGSLTAGRRKVRQWKVPASVRTEVMRFLDDLGMGKVNKGKRLSPQRQLKYLHALRAPLEFFNKPTAAVQMADIERFEKAADSGKVGSQFNGAPYAQSTRVDMRMLLKIFLRWRLGISKAAKLTDWLDTRIKHKTPAFLSEDEVETLFKHCRDARQRFLIAILFDTGARAEEFHNIRFEDIQMPTGKSNFIRITLKEEYSKTLGRTIALFWNQSATAVKDYLAQRIAQGIKPEDPVFSGNYSATRKLLQRLGLRVLKRPVHYHLLRHSSATFYATKLNRQELCYRYGWRFSSDMPDVYISRAGMVSEQLDEKFTQTELSSLKNEVTELREQERIKQDQIQGLQNKVHNMVRHLEQVAELLKLTSDPTLIETALARVRQPSRKA